MSTPKLVKLGPKARKRLRARAAANAAKPVTKPTIKSRGKLRAKASPSPTVDANDETASTRGGARGAMPSMARPSKGAMPSMARPSKGAMPSKASFIMSFGSDVPTRTIVEAGAKRGLKFTQNYVSRIRSLDKARRKRGDAGESRISPRGPSAVRGPDLDARERTFARLAVDLGLANAERILAAVKQKLNALRL